MIARVAAFVCQEIAIDEASGIFAAGRRRGVAALSRRARAQTAVKEIRIGYQKNGVLGSRGNRPRSRKNFAVPRASR